ncbi:uncharacterized protein LOC132700131 isoform X2 [Cylas formicarius]|uniref:uncharacterized protein LOC132700131 isoform X2 n=1 Tax=Cylas formicarius TaxID=197179 RepID=UPI0029587075|nr:uncharacterized protein LOC132700131 isoform X2 [Cylas formicarius]
MEDLAKKCVQDHRQPLVRVNLPGTKLFYKPRNEQEKVLVKECQINFESVLRHGRVERRCARARATWLEDLGLARVGKLIKNLLKYFGHQNKDGVFLYPEEMLFLLETNRLELHLDDLPITIAEGYSIALKYITLTNYRVFKKLASLGYKLVRFDRFQTTRNMSDRAEQKRKPPTDDEPVPSKKPKDEEDVSKELRHISGIFESLKCKMPTDAASTNGNAFDQEPHYCVFLPSNTNKNAPDFHLYLCEDGELIERLAPHSDVPGLVATCVDDVTFYRLGVVELPFL